MENVKLNFAHLCDMAFLSQEGKANIIGIFKVILSQQFPIIHPKLSVILNLSTDGNIGKHKGVIKITKKENADPIVPKLGFEFEVRKTENNNDNEINLIGDISGIKFENPGDYLVRISIDDNEIKTISFSVIKI